MARNPKKALAKNLLWKQYLLISTLRIIRIVFTPKLHETSNCETKQIKMPKAIKQRIRSRAKTSPLKLEILNRCGLTIVSQSAFKILRLSYSKPSISFNTWRR